MADPVKLEHSGSPTHHEIPTAEVSHPFHRHQTSPENSCQLDAFSLRKKVQKFSLFLVCACAEGPTSPLCPSSHVWNVANVFFLLVSLLFSRPSEPMHTHHSLFFTNFFPRFSKFPFTLIPIAAFLNTTYFASAKGPWCNISIDRCCCCCDWDEQRPPSSQLPASL